MRLIHGRVFDLTTGRLLFELKPPQGMTVVGFSAYEETILGWIRPPGEVTPFAKSAEVARWDLRTGGFLDRSPPPASTLPDPFQVKWVEGGTIAIKDYWVTEEGKPTVSTSIRRVEVWDPRQRGEADRPLWSLSLDHGGGVDLSSDGSRLLVRGTTPAAVARLYCTATGRELLRLPEPKGFRPGIRRGVFGLWDRTGSRYGYGVDGDGKPVGWDFRPVEAKK